MIIGKQLKLLSRVVALLFLCGIGFAAANFSIGTLSKSFAKKKRVKVSYVQRRILNFSGNPILSSGYLVYKAPRYFAQIELRPKKRTLIAKSGWLMIIKNDKVQRRVKLSSYPNMQVQLGILRSVLSGEIHSLKHSFKLSLQGTKQSWLLDLSPKRLSVGNVSAIQIKGQQANIRTLLLRYTNGNITTLSIGRSY